MESTQFYTEPQEIFSHKRLVMKAIKFHPKQKSIIVVTNKSYDANLQIYVQTMNSHNKVVILSHPNAKSSSTAN